MSTNADQASARPPSTPFALPNASELDGVLDSYLAAVEAGRPVDPEALIAAHPALADDLRACLRVFDLADRLVQDLSDGPAGQGAPDPLERLRRVRQALGHIAQPSTASGGTVRADLTPDLAEAIQAYLGHSQSAGVGAGEAAPPATLSGRYHLGVEIGRGGMGSVYRAHDDVLGRELAIKLIRHPAPGAGDGRQARRFVEEAQIEGQLQHPGIVPVYDIGRTEDDRLYFTMKLVEGRTLAELLHDRASPGDDLPRLLGIFLQVCQTLAYAHARGVVHRDLKPSNVMVGAFGEVQVMDWGLAKVLRADQPERDPGAEPVRLTTREQTDEATGSTAGSILGTPAYMAPEQARGEQGQIDERSDVFGLGAILCEVLTGQPPFRGDSPEEIRNKAAARDLADAMARLDACAADGELVALVKNCLALSPADRPPRAGAVADQVTAYLGAVQERLSRAELAEVEERGRRRLTAVAAAALILLGLIGAVAYGWNQHQRSLRTAMTNQTVQEALVDASRLRGEALASPPGELMKWADALASARRAERLLRTTDLAPHLRNRVLTLCADLEREHAEVRAKADQAERDRILVEAIETIRYSGAEHADTARTEREWTAAFLEYGVDIQHLDPRAAGAVIAQRPRAVAVAIASALDNWAMSVRLRHAPEAEWRRLVAVARIADPDPWRNALRDKIEHPDPAALGTLADAKEIASQPVPSIVLLAFALRNLDGPEQGDFDRAYKVLAAGWRNHPDDPWINHDLGLMTDLEHLRRLEESTRYYTAAVATRPRSAMLHNRLGDALRAQNRLHEALSEYRTAARLTPDDPWAIADLADVLQKQGKLDEAIVAFHSAIRLNGAPSWAYFELSYALRQREKLEEAADVLRRGRDLARDDPGLFRQYSRAIKTIERESRVADRFHLILAGKLVPADGIESAGEARLCFDRHLYAAAARFWKDAFRRQPSLADDMEIRERYNAACAAALVGTGRAKDEPPPDQRETAHWRKQAVEWLKDDLAFWTREVGSGSPELKESAVQALRHWMSDSDLVGVREKDMVDRLPEAEQKACRALWAEVDQLLRKIG